MSAGHTELFMDLHSKVIRYSIYGSASMNTRAQTDRNLTTAVALFFTSPAGHAFMVDGESAAFTLKMRMARA